MPALRLARVACAALFGLVLASPSGAAEKPAKELFGAKRAPADLASRSIGSYSRGCLAGAAMLPVNGPAWQAMRLSRNRNWGHPALVAYVERLARDSQAKDGWPGLLVGDLAQPRGGPMLTGHASHQIGLDADIWLMPMPDRTLTPKEREEISAVSMIKDNFSINPEVWKPGHVTLLRRAASYPEVARIFVHPAIKKALCDAAGKDRAWLEKIRPWWGHHYHFHVRISCPPGSPGCKEQDDPPDGDGCGKPLDDWFAMFRKPPPPKPDKPAKPKPPITMAALPGECRAVLDASDGAAAAVPASFQGEPPVPPRAPAAPAAAAPPQAVAPLPTVPLPEANPRTGPARAWLNSLTTPRDAGSPPVPERKPSR
ncbi:MAG: penicillin-insensitive murein endopeptidase [Hyphomicrobiales bacterium]